MSLWMSIEVFDGTFSARSWADTHIDSIIETAITHGAIDWELLPTAWGVAFEVEFANEAAWNAFRMSDAFDLAFAHVPNARNVLIYRGRSLDGGATSWRKPKPKSGAGSEALPLPVSLLESLGSFEPLELLYLDDVLHRHAIRRPR